MTTDLVKELAAFGAAPVPEGDYNFMHPVTTALRHRDSVRGLVRQFDDRVTAVRTNRDLTAQGQRVRIAEAAQEALRDLQSAETELRRCQGELQTVHDRLQLRADSSQAESAALAVQHAEVRSYLLAMDPTARYEATVDAVETGDVLVAEAILTAPRVFRLLPEDIVRLLREQLAELKAPALGKEVRDLAAAVEALDAALGTARRLIAAAAGLDLSGLESVARG